MRRGISANYANWRELRRYTPQGEPGLSQPRNNSRKFAQFADNSVPAFAFAPLLFTSHCVLSSSMGRQKLSRGQPGYRLIAQGVSAGGGAAECLRFEIGTLERGQHIRHLPCLKTVPFPSQRAPWPLIFQSGRPKQRGGRRPNPAGLSEGSR